MAKLLTAFRDWRRARFAKTHTAAHGDLYTAHGLDVEVPQSVDAGVRYLLAKGRPYEAEEAHFIQTALRHGTHVIELGGSLGVVSRVIRRTIGPDARHVIAEANPDLAPICEANATRDVNAGCTKVLQAAVAYTDAPTIAFSRGGNAHEGKIARAGDTDSFEAPVITLSQILQDLPDAPYALVADIEGGEAPLFEAEPASTFDRLTHAIIEIHPRTFQDMGTSEDAFLRLVASKGLVLKDRRADVILFDGPLGGR